MIPIIRNSYCLLLFILFCVSGSAQYYKYRADIAPVSENGFYSLTLTPEISRHLKVDYGDLRFVDEKGDTVPFIIKSNASLTNSSEFTSFPIIDNRLSDSGKSIVIIQNKTQETTGTLILKIKNASVTRRMNLSGSDDNMHWFSIRENIFLMNGYSTNGDSYFENVEFPRSSYKYFKLTISNSKNDPLNIIAIGILKATVKMTPFYLDNPAGKFTQHDSNDHQTYIVVDNSEKCHVEMVRIRLKGPKFFKRDVTVRGSLYDLGHFVISSDSLFVFYLPAFSDSVWTIRIDNGDNPPLEIQSVETGQEFRKAIAYLKNGTRYSLQMGNRFGIPPKYDLQDFRDSVPFDAPELIASRIEPVRNMISAPPHVFFKQAWLWPVILLVISTMAFLTYRLTKEVGKK